MIDTHAHLVTQDTAAFPPAPTGGEPLAAGALDNHFTREELAAALTRTGVEKAVAVQRGHVYGYDNRYVLDAAASDPEHVAAVVSIDTADRAAGPAAKALRAAGAAGFRFAAPTMKTQGTDWFTGAPALAVWEAAAASGASLCLHVFRWNRDLCLAALLPLLERFPDVPLVLDHAGNPTFEEPAFGLDRVAVLAAYRRVSVKISTINFQQLGKIGGDPAAFTSAVVARFGAERVMWGSDVAQSAGRYDDLVAAAHAAVVNLTPAQRHAVLHETAQRVYFANGVSARSDP